MARRSNHKPTGGCNLTNWLTDWLADSPTDYLTHSLTDRLTNWPWRETTSKYGSCTLKAGLLSQKTSRWASELQNVRQVFEWILQGRCLRHAKRQPRHTESCNRDDTQNAPFPQSVWCPKQYPRHDGLPAPRSNLKKCSNWAVCHGRAKPVSCHREVPVWCELQKAFGFGASMRHKSSRSDSSRKVLRCKLWKPWSAQLVPATLTHVSHLVLTSGCAEQPATFRTAGMLVTYLQRKVVAENV